MSAQLSIDPHLVSVDETTWRYVRPERRVRFMFDDGRTVDVLTARDDSDVRDAVLKACGAEKIVGTAYLEVEYLAAEGAT